jgi:DNA-binding NtrC family response regulator
MPDQGASADLGSQLADAVTSHIKVAQAFLQSAAEDLGWAARSNLPVLITARSGLERETLARLIHRGSSRGEGPFMKIDCDVQRVDSLERLIEAAAGGTVFLDEVGALRRPMQNALYALLERDARSGAEPSKPIDVGIISGSSRSLRGQVAAGTFGEDLFYRLNVIHVAPAGPPDAGTRRAHVRSDRPRSANVFPRALDE